MISKQLQKRRIMDALFTNESLANLILSKLDDEYQVADFSEINSVCYHTAKKRLSLIRDENQRKLEERKTVFVEEYYSLYMEYINLCHECRQPGMFYFHITDCFEKIGELEHFCNSNDETKFKMYTLDHVSQLKEELEEYEQDFIESEFYQFNIEFDD